jgi:hypothetical protein
MPSRWHIGLQSPLHIVLIRGLQREICGLLGWYQRPVIFFSYVRTRLHLHAYGTTAKPPASNQQSTLFREPHISARQSSPAASDRQNSLNQQSTVFREPHISARPSSPAARQNILIQQTEVRVQRATHLARQLRVVDRTASFSSQLCSESHTFQRVQARPLRVIDRTASFSRQKCVCREPHI